MKIARLSVPARVIDTLEPCLYCGTFAFLEPARVGGHRVACPSCAAQDRPHAMGASRERKLNDVELDARGVTDVKGYRRRQ